MADATFADVIRAIVKVREQTPDLAWMLDIPGVGNLLVKRAAGQIDDQKFEYELYKTRWWKRHSDAQRQWRTLVSIDPGKAVRQRKEMTERVRQLMGEMGVRLPGRGKIKREGGAIGKTAAARVADLALYNGWNEDQVTNYLLSQATWGQEGQAPTGGIAVAMNEIRQLEEQFGVRRRDRGRFSMAKDILGGRQSTEGVTEMLRRQAMAKYGQNEELAGVLDRGGTLADWFDPYRQMISEELEIPDAEISMNDRKWQAVLNGNGEDGRVRPMSFQEAQRYVRTQDEWGKTKGAQESAAELVNGLLDTFGKRAQ